MTYGNGEKGFTVIVNSPCNIIAQGSGNITVSNNNFFGTAAPDGG